MSWRTRVGVYKQMQSNPIISFQSQSFKAVDFSQLVCSNVLFKFQNWRWWYWVVPFATLTYIVCLAWPSHWALVVPRSGTYDIARWSSLFNFLIDWIYSIYFLDIQQLSNKFCIFFLDKGWFIFICKLLELSLNYGWVYFVSIGANWLVPHTEPWSHPEYLFWSSVLLAWSVQGPVLWLPVVRPALYSPSVGSASRETPYPLHSSPEELHDGEVSGISRRAILVRFHGYRQTPNIRRTWVGNKIVDHSDAVGASPVGAAPTTSSFLT